jgi:hypothetical protein
VLSAGPGNTSFPSPATKQKQITKRQDPRNCPFRCGSRIGKISTDIRVSAGTLEAGIRNKTSRLDIVHFQPYEKDVTETIDVRLPRLLLAIEDIPSKGDF